MDISQMSITKSLYEIETLIDNGDDLLEENESTPPKKINSKSLHSKSSKKIYVENDEKILIDVDYVENDAPKILKEKEEKIKTEKLKSTSAETNKLSEVEHGCDICKYYGVVGNEILHNHAQEPWPKDVRLFQPYEVEQILLPDNANCLAVQTFLKMCNLDYTVDARPNAEAMSPTGKVPFIKCGAFIVSELEGIVQFVGNKGITLTQDFSPEEKSDLRAYMTLVNNVLGNAEMYICWCDNETYTDVTKTRYGSIYPWPLNHIQPWRKRSEEIKRLKILGWYQKTLEEVYVDVETCCQSLTDRLNKKEYFFGKRYTEFDALIYAHLYLMLITSLPAHLGMIVKKFEDLIDFCKRIHYDIYGVNIDLEPKTFRNVHKRVVFQDAPSIAVVDDDILPETVVKSSYSNISTQS